MASFEWPPSGSGSGGSGTVTSVGLLDSTGFFNVTGSPVTTSGTLTLASFKSQAQNAVFIGPVSGGAGAPTFRVLQSADIPTLPYISTTLGATATSGGFTVSGNTLSASQSSATVNGWLSSTDWTTFNGKQAAGSYISALTGDITATGPGSAVATLATVNSSPGTTAISTVTTNAKGLVTSNTAASTTGSGSVVLGTSPTLSNPVVGTQSQFNGTTLAASTSYVDTAVANAVAGINPAVAVQAATTVAANTSGFTYNNGVSGVGATFTGTTNTAIVIDGFTFTAIGQRLLVKNDTQSPSGAFNGIYYVTQVQTSLLPPILTRALDYDTPSDINNTGAIPVVNGTVNGTTSWVETAQVVTVGTTPLVFVQFSVNPSTILTNPMTTSGDTIYGGAAGVPTRLANGTNGQFIQSTGGISAPVWASPFQFYISSKVSTISSAVTSGSFVTFSNSPALSFTPTVSGTYKVYASIPVQADSASNSAVFRVFNTTGSGTLLAESQAAYIGMLSDVGASVFIQSVYTLTAGTAYAFDIQGERTSGSGNVYCSGNVAAFYMFAERAL